MQVRIVSNIEIVGINDVVIFIDNQNVKILQDIHTMIAKHKVTYGIFFVENINIIKDLPTNINQNIKFVNVENWKVYEHYKINGHKVMNQLGFLTDDLKYVPIFNSSFVERRSNFHGYQMITMTDVVFPFIDLTMIRSLLKTSMRKAKLMRFQIQHLDCTMNCILFYRSF